MAGAAVAFRSDKPEVVKAFEDARDAYNEWRRELIAWVEQNLGENFAPVTMAAFGGEAVYGVRHKNSTAPGECPPGRWKWHSGNGYFTPDRRYKAGKALVDRFDPNRNRAPNVRGLTPGMPGYIFGAGAPGLALRDGVLWASYAHDVGDEEWQRNGLDFAQWERAPLSAYYLATENSEAA